MSLWWRGEYYSLYLDVLVRCAKEMTSLRRYLDP